MKKVEIGNPLIRLQSVDSTNNYAAQLIKQGSVQEGTVILAVHQTQGKGQAGSQWQSEEGVNLLISAILRPDFLPADKQFYLSMCVATAIADFIERFGVQSMIKWPNDIMIGKRKVAWVPTPSIDSIPIVPFIISVSCFVIQRPKPVPAIWRVFSFFAR